ncbi:MAG: hypoxanthine phosphoribosyltransferase [Pirellulaceae bacterium]|nr:hypoxanthine phosphoribosyltransferase [Planctomycetota bacterium]
MRVLLDEETILAGVASMSAEIRDCYGDTPVTIIGVLTGSVVLLADLIRKLDMPLRVGVIQTSSYEGTSRGKLRINSELMLDIRDRHVLIVDDIFDTGHTLTEVVSLLGKFQPASVRSAVLLKKTGRKEVDMDPDFAAFDIPDEFVVGYGLDYNDAYRDLPFVAVLESKDLAEHG